MSDDWQVVEEALRLFKHHWLGDPEAALARLREREAQMEREKIELELACDHHRMFWQQAEKRERAAEACVARLEEALRDAENTLRIYATGTDLIGLRHRIVAALAHEEETP